MDLQPIMENGELTSVDMLESIVTKLDTLYLVSNVLNQLDDIV